MKRHSRNTLIIYYYRGPSSLSSVFKSFDLLRLFSLWLYSRTVLFTRKLFPYILAFLGVGGGGGGGGGGSFLV